MEEKKKRGSNYTALEKKILIGLIKKHQNVINSKEISGSMISKKREAWNSVCKQYNGFAVSGFRTRQQLRHLYDNIKQRTKKNIPEKNIEICHTCGRAYKGSQTEQDTQNLDVIVPQVQPISNSSYDDGVLYLDDHGSSMATVSQDEPSKSTTNLDGILKNEENIINNIKLKYFKTKLRNAELERKYQITRNKMQLYKFKTEMETLKLRLQRLKSPRKMT